MINLLENLSNLKKLLFRFLKNRNNSVILAPVETTSRDTYWKIRLFTEIPKSNILIIGRYEIINDLLGILKSSIYLGKNIIQHGGNLSKKINKKLNKISNKNNHRIFFIDEEGGLFNLNKFERKKIFIKRHPLDKLPPKTKVFVWGQEQLKLIKSYYHDHLHDKEIYSTGCPRFRPISENYRKSIKSNMNKKFGEYILLNSNFSQSTSTSLSEIFSKDLWRNHHEQINHEMIELETMSLFLQIIEFLDKTLDNKIKIIIKVHPAEDIRFYNYISSIFKKVLIIGKTDLPISDFIIGSTISISSRCTTSIEAKLLEVPSISIGSKRNNNEIPINSKELNVYDIEEFKFKFDFLNKNLKNKNFSNEDKNSMKILKNLDDNIKQFTYGIYDKDSCITNLRDSINDIKENSKGIFLTIIYSLISSIIIQLMDQFKKYLFKIIKRDLKRQLKFSNLNSKRIRDELNIYNQGDNYRIFNFFGQILILIKN